MRRFIVDVDDTVPNTVGDLRALSWCYPGVSVVEVPVAPPLPLAESGWGVCVKGDNEWVQLRSFPFQGEAALWATRNLTGEWKVREAQPAAERWVVEVNMVTGGWRRSGVVHDAFRTPREAWDACHARLLDAPMACRVRRLEDGEQ